MEGLSFFLGQKGGTTTKHTMSEEDEDEVEVVTPGEDGAEVAQPSEDVVVPGNASTSDELEVADTKEDDMDEDVKVGDDAAPAE
ncbi:MAG: hypothetical protein JWN49_563 [Parcubacteria group bacterium]|nr:hypothetical protein [Parcubacteria group bacterium]